MSQPADLVRNGAAGSPATGVQRLRRLLDIARGARHPLVHLQHNPDPDALASAMALRALLARFLNVDAVLAYTGRVGRVENRAMLRELNIQIIPSFKIDYREHDFVAVVDTHPGAGTCRLPEGVTPQLVVDHHPGIAKMEGVVFPYYDPAYGSTSTMVGALFIENGIPMDARVATALTYGIRTDTQDLARGATAEDEKVFREVYALSDKQILSRIERARVRREYFVVLERGLRQALISDFALTAWLGRIDHSDMVAEVADLLFRLEGMRWVMVAGYSEPMLFASLRATPGNSVEAGVVAREISDGNGGGHPTFAACQMRIPADGPPADVAYERLRERFLDAVGAKRTLTQPLTDSPNAATRATGSSLGRRRRNSRGRQPEGETP